MINYEIYFVGIFNRQINSNLFYIINVFRIKKIEELMSKLEVSNFQCIKNKVILYNFCLIKKHEIWRLIRYSESLLKKLLFLYLLLFFITTSFPSTLLSSFFLFNLSRLLNSNLNLFYGGLNARI